MVKETRTTSHKQRKKTLKKDATDYMLTSPFQKEDLLRGINVLKSNKAAGLRTNQEL